MADKLPEGLSSDDNSSLPRAPIPHGTRLEGALALLAIGFTLLAYFPLTRNYFYADDFLYLYRIANSDFLTYLLEPHAGHLLMARNLVYYLCYEVFLTWAPGYFWVVLLTHLLNVFLLFRTVHRFTGSLHLACFGAALWGASPLQEGSLGWYSVYGHVMVGSILCFLLSMAPQVPDDDRSGVEAGLVLALLLFVASTSFGVGLGLVVAMPFATLLLVRDTRLRHSAFVSSVLVACAVPILFLWMNQRLAEERIESAGVLLSGLHHPVEILIALLQLIGYGTRGLLLGPFLISGDSAALAYGSAALVAVIALVALGGVPSDDRKSIAGGLLLSIACYGAVALALVSRTVFLGRVAVGEGRYQYAGSIGLLLVLCLAAKQAARRWPLSKARRNTLLGAGLIWIGIQIVFGTPIDHHDDARKSTARTVGTIQQTIERAPLGADVFIENRRFAGIGTFLFKALRKFPGWAGLFVIEFPDNEIDGRRIFFVTDDEKALDGAANGKRTAGLLLDPEQARQLGWQPPPTPEIEEPSPTELVQ